MFCRGENAVQSAFLVVVLISPLCLLARLCQPMQRHFQTIAEVLLNASYERLVLYKISPLVQNKLHERNAVRASVLHEF